MCAEAWIFLLARGVRLCVNTNTKKDQSAGETHLNSIDLALRCGGRSTITKRVWKYVRHLYRCTVRFVVYLSNTPTNAHI